MSELLYFRESRFEAARFLKAASDHESRLHGHGFKARVQGLNPAGMEFNYRDLNSVFDHPTDCQILQKLSPSGFGSLSSRPDRGVRKDEAGRMFAYRIFQFESAHQLPNVPPGHKCGRLHGHGFQAVIHVPIQDPLASWHLDYARIEAAWAPIGIRLHHQYLNEIEGLQNPTSEWLSVWIWNALQDTLPDLAWVTVYETASCGAHFDGEVHRIWKDFSIDSAVKSGTQTLGHTWIVRLHLKGPLHPVFGWALDFAEMKRDFEPLFQSLDHQPLHESMKIVSPDLAGIARFIHEHGPLVLPTLGRVDVLESSGLGVSLDWGLQGIQVLP